MIEEPVSVDASLHGPWGRIQAWLHSGPPGADLLLVRVAFSPVLSDQSFVSGDAELREFWSMGGWGSWLGGPAAAPLDRWPHAVDGTALAPSWAGPPATRLPCGRSAPASALSPTASSDCP